MVSMRFEATPPDGPSHPNERCVSCHGSATTLVVSQTYGLPPKPIYACYDRELCKMMMILDNMIAQVRSA